MRWLIGVDRTAAGRWQGWLCFTVFPCLVPVCLCFCQSRLPVLRPRLAWHLSSLWWYTGYSWHPDLLACCWGVALPLPAVIFSLDEETGGVRSVDLTSTQLCLFPRNSLTWVSQHCFFFSIKMYTDLIFVPEVGNELPTENDWRNWQGLIKGSEVGEVLESTICFWRKTDLQYCPKQRACWAVWNHFIFLSFTFFKQVPVYFSCSRDCCTALLSWSSRNVT